MRVAPFDLSARIICGFVLRHIYSFHRYPPTQIRRSEVVQCLSQIGDEH